MSSFLFYFHRYKISVLILVPSVVLELVNHPDIEKADLSSVSMIRCGAAYLPQDMAKKLTSLASKDTSFSEGTIIIFSCEKFCLLNKFFYSPGWGMSELVCTYIKKYLSSSQRSLSRFTTIDNRWHYPTRIWFFEWKVEICTWFHWCPHTWYGSAYHTRRWYGCKR